MLRQVIVPLLCCLELTLAACTKQRASDSQTIRPKIDACLLITKEEVEAVQGSPIKETKSSERLDGAFHVSQCFYTAAEFNKSVSLTVTRRDPDSSAGRSPKDYWKAAFGRYASPDQQPEGDNKSETNTKAVSRDQEEREKSFPPQEIKDIGDEAYWTGRVSATLYVLSKDAFIAISAGGSDNEQVKIDRCKALAEKALGRL